MKKHLTHNELKSQKCCLSSSYIHPFIIWTVYPVKGLQRCWSPSRDWTKRRGKPWSCRQTHLSFSSVSLQLHAGASFGFASRGSLWQIRIGGLGMGETVFTDQFSWGPFLQKPPIKTVHVICGCELSGRNNYTYWMLFYNCPTTN